MEDNNLKEYLFENSVDIVGNYFSVQGLNDENKLLSHIDIIVQVQNILMRYHSFSKNSIISEIGKENSKLEVLGRKLEKRFSDIKGCSIEKNVIDRFNNIISELKDERFKLLIKRAILRDEICVEKLDLSNLRVIDEIEIGKIKKASYNLIEEDFIKYLKKIKKFKSYNFILECVDRYVEKSALDSVSKEYILLKLKLPEDSIKYLYKNTIEDIEAEELLRIMCKDDLII